MSSETDNEDIGESPYIASPPKRPTKKKTHTKQTTKISGGGNDEDQGISFFDKKKYVILIAFVLIIFLISVYYIYVYDASTSGKSVSGNTEAFNMHDEVAKLTQLQNSIAN